MKRSYANENTRKWFSSLSDTDKGIITSYTALLDITLEIDDMFATDQDIVQTCIDNFDGDSPAMCVLSAYMNTKEFTKHFNKVV